MGKPAEVMQEVHWTEEVKVNSGCTLKIHCDAILLGNIQLSTISLIPCAIDSIEYQQTEKVMPQWKKSKY